MSERREWSEINTLRGLAAVCMVVHHVWATYWTRLGLLGNAVVFVGSCAPVLFFFVTGLGYGAKGSSVGPVRASALKKVAILLIADQFLFWRVGHTIGLDFLGFIGIASLVLEVVTRTRRPQTLALGLIGAVLAARYAVGSKAGLGILGLEQTTWFRVLVGADGFQTLAYPPCPWLVYPLLGYLAGRWFRDRRESMLAAPARLVVGLLGAGSGALAFALLLVSRGAVVYRWSSVSLAFFVMSVSVLAAAVVLAIVIDKRPALAELISLRGIASLAFVPLHYSVIAVFRSSVPPPGAVMLALVMALVGFVSFWASREVAAGIQVLAGLRQSRMLGMLFTTFVLIAAVVLFGRWSDDERFTTACMALGQLSLTVLLSLDGFGVVRTAPRASTAAASDGGVRS